MPHAYGHPPPLFWFRSTFPSLRQPFSPVRRARSTGPAVANSTPHRRNCAACRTDAYDVIDYGTIGFVGDTVRALLVAIRPRRSRTAPFWLSRLSSISRSCWRPARFMVVDKGLDAGSSPSPWRACEETSYAVELGSSLSASPHAPVGEPFRTHDDNSALSDSPSGAVSPLQLVPTFAHVRRGCRLPR